MIPTSGLQELKYNQYKAEENSTLDNLLNPFWEWSTRTFLPTVRGPLRPLSHFNFNEFAQAES